MTEYHHDHEGCFSVIAEWVGDGSPRMTKNWGEGWHILVEGRMVTPKDGTIEDAPTCPECAQKVWPGELKRKDA